MHLTTSCNLTVPTDTVRAGSGGSNNTYPLFYISSCQTNLSNFCIASFICCWSAWDREIAALLNLICFRSRWSICYGPKVFVHIPCWASLAAKIKLQMAFFEESSNWRTMVWSLDESGWYTHMSVAEQMCSNPSDIQKHKNKTLYIGFRCISLPEILHMNGEL